MKTKEQILANYYTQGADGMPEIAADGLLKAMEEYRVQAEEAAFNAGRSLNSDVAYIDHSFASFEAYQASLVIPITAAPAEPSEADTIQFIADTILEQFIPHDKTVEQISFNIRTNGKEYTVNYHKTEQGYWVFHHYAPTK